MDRYEKQLTDYIAGLSPPDLSAEAVQAAKERLLDSLATALAAYNVGPARAMRAFALEAEAVPGATVLGTPHRAPVDYAAVYLGTLIRALDWNDTYLRKEPAHPSDNLPACLCVAEALERRGEDLLLALVLTYELHCRLCDAAGIRKKGWDHVTYGSVASAAAAAKLLGFDRRRIRDALAIAVTTGNYLRQTRIGTISQWKAAAFAQACQNAVRCAWYVRHGMDGPSDIFTGQHGWIAQITQGEFDLAPRFGGQDGEAFKIVDTYIKYYPAEYHAQSAIWAALALRDEIGEARLGEIDRVHVETSHHSWEIIGKEPAKWHPQTKETADHSLPYIVAVALREGAVGLEQFDERHLRDPQLAALVQKVTVDEQPKYTELYGRAFPNKVRVTLKSGPVFEKEVMHPKGHPQNPLTREELEQKFRTAADPLLETTRQDKILDSVWNLENLGSVRELMDLLVVK